MRARVLSCSLLSILLAGQGPAPRALETTIQDDALLLHRPLGQVREAVRTMHGLGADRVRITAGWSALAPSPRARKKPGEGFDPTDSRTYPEAGFERLDRAIVEARRTGLDVQLDVAFFAPRWAVARKGGNPERERFLPDAREFGRFTRAVAERYSGRFRGLPAVRLWTTWNEPNEPNFLKPQWKKRRNGTWRAFSPHLYRAMHTEAYDALKAVSADNVVLAGGTSAKGSRVDGRGPVAPLRFLRELTCTTPVGTPMTVPECRGYTPLKADGWAHHPYSFHGAPDVSDPDPDDVPIGDVGRLAAEIGHLAALGRIERELPLYLTEYGYETKPPDPFQRHSPEQQAAFLGQATWLAHRTPGVRMFAQFLLRDIAPADGTRGKEAWRDFQTGLFFADGTAKPAAQAFKLPFYAQLVSVTPSIRAIRLFGGVRPNANGREVVRVQRFDVEGGRWEDLPTASTECGPRSSYFLTDREGWFESYAPWHGPVRLRLVWSPREGVDDAGPAIELNDGAPAPLSAVRPRPGA